MEEQRISRMYWSIVVGRLERAGRFLLGPGFRSSSLFLPAILAILVGTPVVVFLLHRHAKFHDLKKHISGDSNTTPAGPQPGGRDPVVLSRAAGNGAGSASEVPEFLSVTLLPGLGMDVLQITARMPGMLEAPLLMAPTLEEVADGTLPAPRGVNDVHGAIELPWGGALEGTTNLLATSLTTEWSGHTIVVPTNPKAPTGLAEGGLLDSVDTDSVQQMSSPVAQSAMGKFSATDFDGHWPSKIESTVTVTLGATTLDLDVVAMNAGVQPAPVGIGWHPRFALDGTDRHGVMVRMPNGEQLELGSRHEGIPTGKVLQGSGNADFLGHPGTLSASGVDAAIAHPRGSSLDPGPLAEMRNVQAGYGIRLIAMSSNTQEMQVFAPAGADYVSLGAQTNLDDPFGRAWSTSEEPIKVLQPGQSVEWKVRLEIFPIRKGPSLP